MIRVFLDIRQGFRTGYFPVYHPWNPFLILLFRLWNGKSLVTAHEGRLHLGEDYAWEQWLVNRSIKWADGVIFLSESERQNTCWHTPFPGRSWVIRHGILQLPGLRSAPRSLPPCPALLFLGRIVKYKGIELLLESVSLLPEGTIRHLTIAGDANYAVPNDKPSANVKWSIGWLSEKQIAQLLNEHDILVLPYLEASQSGIVTLGISAAIPMICTRVGGLAEQLAENEAVWVAPDVPSLSAGIRKLVSNPALYSDLHYRLIQKGENKGWTESARKVEAIINAL